MKQFDISNIKSIALLGHGSSGKTTLADAMLYVAGMTDRIGSTADATTVMDFDAEEKQRKVSISTSVYQFEYKDKKINLLLRFYLLILTNKPKEDKSQDLSSLVGHHIEISKRFVA